MNEEKHLYFSSSPLPLSCCNNSLVSSLKFFNHSWQFNTQKILTLQHHGIPCLKLSDGTFYSKYKLRYLQSWRLKWSSHCLLACTLELSPSLVQYHQQCLPWCSLMLNYMAAFMSARLVPLAWKVHISISWCFKCLF